MLLSSVIARPLLHIRLCIAWPVLRICRGSSWPVIDGGDSQSLNTWLSNLDRNLSGRIDDQVSDFIFFTLPRHVTCLSELSGGGAPRVLRRACISVSVGVLVALRLNTLVSIASNLKVASMTRDGAYTDIL